MPLPDNFSPVEHLQDTIRRTFSREVREWFRDIDLDGDLDIATPRSSLALACEHRDDDSFNMTIGRILLFETLRGRFADRLVNASSGAGSTTYRTDVRRRTRPKISLYFIEDANDVETGYAPVDGTISFRLMDHTPSSITPVIAQTYAQRIKSNFDIGGGFVWKKGKNMYSYSDWPNGYQLQLLCRTDTEARRIVDAVLDVQSHVPDWSYFNEKINAEPASAFPIIPDIDRAYGEQRRQPRRRPVADVRFQYATLEVLGVANPVVLVDRSGVLPTALVS
ncbi:hypothetical protein IQ260_00500 [Leptolyngbya cf. ectocarpi LEGE 11479]|uniref:Uncharacterized protein n=2 Tax=Leptolyngbya ectocarpi TaxID=1202 RepID=A0A928WYE4_LEPEC|nr:hypothetical protein [Leptolyngbya cf. ectocarpi LEGE 11479]